MSEPSSTPRRKSRKRWLAWALLVAGCAGLAAAKIALDVHRTRAQYEWQLANVRHARRTVIAQRALHYHLAPARGESLDVLQQKWRLDPQSKVELGEGVVRYTAPGSVFDGDISGFRVMLTFENNTLSGFSITPPPGPPRPTFPLWVFLHRAFILLAFGPALVWAVLVLAIAYEKARAAQLAEAALGLAILAQLSWTLLRFGPHRPAAGVVSYSGLAVGGAMVVASIVLLSWGVRRRRRLEEGRCATCLYDLTGNESGVCPECGTPTRGRTQGHSYLIPHAPTRPPGHPAGLR